MNIIQIIGLAIATVVLSSVLKQYKPEFATLLITLSGLIFLLYITGRVTGIFELIRDLCNFAGISIVYIELMFKVVGVAYMCEFVSAVCKDAGESAIAIKVDIVGKLIILGASIPVFKELLDVITKVVL